MKWIVTVIALFVSVASFSQIKDDISVVQFSAKFVASGEISLKSFDVNKETLYISENQSIFENENIKYLPTIIVYQDGEEMKRIEAGIDLKLPEGCLEDLQVYVSELLEARF